VLEEIKKMINVIKEEEKADKENLDWCGSEREEYEGNKEKTEDSILSLEETIEKITVSIEHEETGFKVMIKQNEEDLKANHDNQVTQTTERQAENKAYQIEIKNIVTAEELLEKAIKVLEKYYSQFDSFRQTEDPADEAPTTWDDKEGGVQKDAGADVIKTLKFIADATQKEETEAHETEEAAQHDFEDAMKELKDSQAKLEKTIVDLKEELARAEKELGETKVELEKTQAELKSIKNYLAKIKPGCDYIEKNYEERKKNRETEEKALEEAVGLIKDTPAFKAAEVAAAQEALGDCKDTCNEHGRKHAECEACLAGTSVPGYCAGHAGTEGC